jgi:hypothetical protein
MGHIYRSCCLNATSLSPLATAKALGLDMIIHSSNVEAHDLAPVMVLEGLARGVQNGGDADVGTEVFWIGGDQRRGAANFDRSHDAPLGEAQMRPIGGAPSGAVAAEV